MSLRGRYVIDRIKHAIGHRFTLPVPPYGDTRYWERVYEKAKFGPEDVFEWADLTLRDDLMQHDYRLLQQITATNKNHGESSPEHDETSSISTSFGEAIGVMPSNNSSEDDASKKPILILGCGNSKWGEDMVENGWRGPLIQVDVVSRVLEFMSERCAPHVEAGVMDFVHDDATQLSAFGAKSMNGVIDKGLLDALFCANQFDQVQNVMTSVHRVLKPEAIFCALSFSRPDYILPKLLPTNESHTRQIWQDVQVRELPSILMYRFQKRATKKKKSQSNRSRARNKKQARRQ